MLRRSSRIGATASMSSATSYSAVTRPLSVRVRFRRPVRSACRPPPRPGPGPPPPRCAFPDSGAASRFGGQSRCGPARGAASAASAGTKRPVCGACGSGDAPATGSSHSPRTSAAPPIPSPTSAPGDLTVWTKLPACFADAQRQPLPRERAVRRVEIGGDQPRLLAGVAPARASEEPRQRPAGVPAGSPVSVRSRSRSQPPGIAGKAAEL